MANHHTRAVPEIDDGQREELERWLRRSKTGQALALRARIVLASAEGESDMGVAARLGTTRETVGKWRRRFIEKGCDGLLDEPRPGAPRTVSDADVERVVTMTLESMPRGATQWSTRSMAKACGMSSATVNRIWRAFGLQPHRTETFKLSADPLFIEKVRDVVGLYMAPPERAVVLCVDEKSQIQALDRTQPMLPLRPGTPARQTHDLQAQRHHLALRRPRHRHGRSHREMLPAPPVSRVQEVPHGHREGGAEGAGCPSGPRQLRHAQDRDDPQVASSDTLASTCTSPRPARHGSTRSNAGSPRSRTSRSGVGATGAPANSSRPSRTTWPPTTRTPGPSSGRSQPTTSWNPSKDTAKGLPIQNT